MLEAEDGLDHADEVLRRLPAGERGQVGLQPLLHLLVEVRGVFVFSCGDQGVFHPSDPAIKNVAESAAGAGGGTQLGHHLAVDVIEAVKLEVVVGDDHEAGGEAALLGIEQGQAGHEGLAAAVAAAQELDRALATTGQLQLAVQLTALLLDAHGEGVDAALGHQPLAQRLEHVLHVLGGQGAHQLCSFT